MEVLYNEDMDVFSKQMTCWSFHPQDHFD